MNRPCPKTHYDLYGIRWPKVQSAAARELHMITKGGRWKTKYGNFVGKGLAFHYEQVIKAIWPHVVWHRWLKLVVDNYQDHRSIVVIGPASSGKTLGAALCVLVDYYAHPTETTVIICSTTKARLEDRIWGELKKLHRMAKKLNNWLPGSVMETEQRLVTDDRMSKDNPDGRDFRNGIVGVPCLKGEGFQGLGSFAGLKAKRMRLLGDELSLLPRMFVDSISNLDKNPDFKLLGLGNPKETTDALGVLAEPAANVGGWDGGIDQAPQTKTWPTRRPQGICIQLVGSDSPNLDGKLGCPLITQEQIDRDIAFYGRDSLWFTMMDQGMMPRGQGSRRVLTRQACVKFKAFEQPIWLGDKLNSIAFLDAAYGGVGGDRCIFGTLDFGHVVPENVPQAVVEALLNQSDVAAKAPIVLALTSLENVPLNPQSDVLIVDQIVNFVRARCENAARSIPPENFFYDSGMRTNLVSAFARLWSPNVCPIDFGGKATDRKVSEAIDVKCVDYYSKFVTELWFSVRYIVESGQFRGMTDDLCYEFSAREWTMVGANKIEVEPKKKMKEKTGRSPDLADAVACGVEGARQRGFIIRKLANVEAIRVDDRWKRDLRTKAEAMHRRPELNPAA